MSIYGFFMHWGMKTLISKNNASKQDEWFSIGYQAHQTGNFVKAERYYRRVLRQQPADAETLYLLGTLIAQQSRPLQEAIALLQRAHKLRPQHPQTLNNLGLAFQRIEDFSFAQSCFEKAISLKPDYAHAYNNLARIFERNEEMDQAINNFRKACELDLNYTDAYYHLGLMLNKQDRFKEAELAFRHAVELAPSEARIWDDLSTVIKAQGRLTEAEHCVRKALEQDHERFSTWNNLGAILHERGDFNGALMAYRQAEALDPANPLPPWNQAFVLLSLGQFTEGWIQHETRWGVFGIVDMPCPVWNGEDLPDGVLLLLAEQGLGDEILYASCIPDAARHADQVIVECASRLAPLYARSFPQVRVVAGADRSNWRWLIGLPKPDRALCIGSLPRLFRPDLTSFPKVDAYLYADPIRIDYWRERLIQIGEGLKVGICWRSGLRVSDRYKHYTTLEDWGPLFAIPGVCFVNLQYDECATELADARERFGINIIDFSEIDLRNDQDEVAALMSALDLVISAATAVAALAGALGRPTWRFSSTYGWTSLGTDYLPFSLTTRLFDKPLPDEPWGPVFERMAAELCEWVTHGSPQNQPLVATTTIPAMTMLMASNYLALALEAHRIGCLDKARNYCQHVLDEYPDHADAWHLSGVVQREQGAWEEALIALDRAHTADPQEPTVLVNRGRTLQDLGRVELAADDFRAALDLDEACLEARLSLGELLDAQGAWQEALAILQPVQTLAPNKIQFIVQAHYAIAQVFCHQRQLTEAEYHLREAVRLDPAYSGAHNGLGNLLRDQDRLEEAFACYQTALTLRPDLPEFHNNLGNVLRELNRLREAEIAYREALRLRPEYPDAWSNLGNLLSDRGLHREAIHAHRRALELLPDDATAHWNISFPLLWEGELTEGWAAYEWRWKAEAQPLVPRFYTEWNGENLAGHSLLVLPEQGLGDEILFASCIPDVIAHAKQVVLVCQERLIALYTRSFPTAVLFPMPAGLMHLSATDLPYCDFQIAIGSLPRLLRTRIRDFPSRPAYLKTDPARVELWRERLAKLGHGLKVGICWRSGLSDGERRRYYTMLADWEPILKTPGVIFINLQYDHCIDDLRDAQMRFGITIHQFPDLDLRNDQDEVATLITAIDGVISAPTAVAELAGALGVPVLRYLGGWTDLGTNYMPWHPTMRVFDKPDLEQPWGPTISTMSAALCDWVAQGGTKARIAILAPQLIESRHGRMLIAGAGAVAEALLQTGEYAPKTLALLASLLRPGDWVVEAGADLGAFTVPLARAVGINGLVIACEPHCDAFRLLCANLALNEITQVHAECLALDAETFTPNHGECVEWRQMRMLRRENIDALALPRCDLLRIGTGTDVLSTLSGAGATLNQFKPFICIEGFDDSPVISERLSTLGYAWQTQNRDSAIADILAYPTAKK